jgi:hypothetical protein
LFDSNCTDCALGRAACGFVDGLAGTLSHLLARWPYRERVGKARKCAWARAAKTTIVAAVFTRR